MRKFSKQTIWALALLLTAVTAGCGREQTPAQIPVVISTCPQMAQ